MALADKLLARSLGVHIPWSLPDFVHRGLAARKLGSGEAAGTIWNPADRHGGIALSNGGLTAAGDGSAAFKNVRATPGKSSGKWYFEWTKTGGANGAIGLADGLAALDAQLGADGHSFGYYDYGGYGYDGSFPAGVPAWGNGDVIGLAVDVAARTLWLAKNGSPLAGDPGAGTGGFAIAGLVGQIFPAFGTHSVSGDGAGTANFGGTEFVHDIPAGFLAWDA